MHIDIQKLTRLEIIGNERLFVRRDISDMVFSLQDDDRTLKIFIQE